MEHIGIDLGGRKSQICVRAADGKILEERAWPTHELGVFLAKRPQSRVVMETCAEAFAVADMARSIGHQVRVVPATLVRSLGVGQRGIKTDVRDARAQSEASCRLDLPSVHIPSTASRHLKTALNLRDALVRTRTQLINTCRGILRQHLVRVPTGATQSFTTRVRSVAGALPQEFAVSLDAHLGVIDVLTARLREATRELGAVVRSDLRCSRLMTAPGVGVITAARFVTTIDDTSRFANAHRLQSYLGLVPGESSSSTRQHRTGLIKAGSTQTRACLVQAAWCIWRLGESNPIAAWGKQIAARRGAFVAICAMARKLAGVLFAMWRDGKPFDPEKLAPAAG